LLALEFLYPIIKNGGNDSLPVGKPGFALPRIEPLLVKAAHLIFIVSFHDTRLDHFQTLENMRFTGRIRLLKRALLITAAKN
jgi:hypothetical protein